MRLEDLGRSNQRLQNALSTLVSMHFLEPETEDCVCVSSLGFYAPPNADLGGRNKR